MKPSRKAAIDTFASSSSDHFNISPRVCRAIERNQELKRIVKQILSYRMKKIVSYRIVSYRIVSYRIVSYRIVSYHIVSYRIVSYRIVSYRIVSYRITSYPVTSHHTLSYHILSYQTILRLPVGTCSDRTHLLFSFCISLTLSFSLRRCRCT
jgi:hypothetical protein